ncbi:MAG: WhiB family transcriptional regulator, partial [Acidimicrobiales bacterium]
MGRTRTPVRIGGKGVGGVGSLSRSGSTVALPSGRLDGSNWNWRDEAKCLGSDPALFFPLGMTGEPLAQAQAAKRICHTCPV